MRLIDQNGGIFLLGAGELGRGKAMAESADGADGVRRPGGYRTWWRCGGRVWAEIRRWLGFGVARVSSPLRKPYGAGSVFVRARLKRARIREWYSYFQEISENAVRKMEKDPEGRIDLELPYDGDRYFSRQARGDIRHARDLGAAPGTEALVGHLVLTGFEHANLDGLLDLGPIHGSVPIRVPIAGLPDPGDADPLIADRCACVLSHDYQPGTRHLKVLPVDVDAKLHDPDDAHFRPPKTESDFAGRRLQMLRQVGFLPELQLQMTVRLDVPRELADGARAKIRQVFISWPTHTSLQSLHLRVDGKTHPLRYNPKREGLEWSDVTMICGRDPGAGEIRSFSSPEMVLTIPQPGELYQQPSLDGQVKVTVNRLLSGMDARLFDATGASRGRSGVMRQSLITTNFRLILDDAFARRILSPHQQLHFDEVIPAETRIDDIKMALKNLGFKVADPWPDHGPEKRWLWASRAEGPEKLELVLYAEGKQHTSKRQRRVPGGITYHTKLDSGELRIYVYGKLSGNSGPVVQEMNALREALRERFDRLPARR